MLHNQHSRMQPLQSLLLVILLLPSVFAQKGHNAAPKQPAAKPTATRSSKPAASAQFKTLDAVIDDAIEQKQCPGAVVLVGHHGRVVYKKAYGMRSLEPTREK